MKFYRLKITRYSCSIVIHSWRNSVSYLRVYNTTLLSNRSAVALNLFTVQTMHHSLVAQFEIISLGGFSFLIISLFSFFLFFLRVALTA